MPDKPRFIHAAWASVLFVPASCYVATQNLAASVVLGASCLWFELHEAPSRRGLVTSSLIYLILVGCGSVTLLLTDSAIAFSPSDVLAISAIPILPSYLAHFLPNLSTLPKDSLSVPGPSSALKRTFDLFASLIALPLTIPLVFCATLATLIADGWPVFYQQRRLGYQGRTFHIVKIRTMIRSAEPDGRPVWSTKDDLRVTKLGRFLRKTWIDELPQIFLIMAGKMSLIGPRPERPEFAQDFTRRWPRFAERLNVRPGLTGWAQARGFSGDTPIEERLEHDLAYIENWTPILDAKIVAATLYRFFDRGDSPRWLPTPRTDQEGKMSPAVDSSHRLREEPDHRHRSQSQHLSQGDQFD